MEFVRRIGPSFFTRPLKRPLAPCRWQYHHVRLNSTALSAPHSIVLRDYQEESIQSVLKYLGEGHRRLGISLATGAGKTVIFTQLIGRIPPRDAKATKTMIIVHRRELVEQAARHCRLAYPDRVVEIEMGNNVATGGGDIIISSIQTLARRIDKFDPSAFKLVLVDEAHHIVAPSYRKALDYFGLNEPAADSPVLVGVSATFSRFDGLKLGAAIDHIVYHKDYVDMIDDKWLSDAIFTTVKSGADLKHVKKDQFGDFAVGSLSNAVNTPTINNITVRAWLANAEDRKSTLVFCVDVAHAKRLTETFREHGVDARFLTGTTHKDARAEQLRAFKAQEFPVLLNCALFTEGTDIPNIDCVLLARPTRSRNLLIQMIGRGLRLFPGKKNCHIIDMVASLEAGILTAPTLFGLHPDEVLKESSTEELRKSADELQEKLDAESNDTAEPAATALSEDDDTKVVHMTRYDSVFDLLNDIRTERYIRMLSPYSWVQVGDRKYVLTDSAGWLTIEKLDELWVVHHVMKFRNEAGVQVFTRPREIASGPDLETAVRAADSFAKSKFQERYISMRESWRQAPVTTGQQKFLKRLEAHNKRIRSRELNRGQAADIITKSLFGGKKRFEKLGVQGRANEKKMDDARKLQEREAVRVGPLDR
ncbi:ATP-dependent helicase IRC3 [Penicillium riverlandense]|uniref:ATP-dependent helicase IRC3 n=1 Tax=Penicillium riverlandense TaxID=1903569 RepID=UPI0025467530|nr:ATP-dependent helicase IRC3 [Penicillium riverlandense]KAJ5833293.1 ATP-dependent helicase IRC3 [Penicillium riverlandense]